MRLIRIPARTAASYCIMAKQQDEPSIYGKPNFGLIVGLFAVGIVVLLICGLIFLRFDPLHLKGHLSPRTGMVLVLPAPDTIQ
jgi:hypothetical protein